MAHKNKISKNPANSGTSMGYSVRGRMWIASGNETFLGYGRVVLLERIKEHGSITKAAKSMDMSYRHAWDLVDAMNRLGEQPLVISAVGGIGGGGAKLTKEGERAIDLFWQTYNRFKEFLQENGQVIEFDRVTAREDDRC